MTFTAPAAFFLQMNIWEMATRGGPLALGIYALLIVFSVFSWAIIFAKWKLLRDARRADARFLRAFRKAAGLDAVMVASEQFRPAPLVAVFDFGYEEVSRQVKARGGIKNPVALERSLQLGISEELTRMERNLNWLATTASVSPFIGLFGTVLGITRAFQELSISGSSSLRAVGPGISDALLATAVGLAAAIPAAIFYNHFGHAIREMGARMDDFSLEFLNLTERTYGE